jgi:hypothetical protein
MQRISYDGSSAAYGVFRQQISVSSGWRFCQVENHPGGAVGGLKPKSFVNLYLANRSNFEDAN